MVSNLVTQDSLIWSLAQQLSKFYYKLFNDGDGHATKVLFGCQGGKMREVVKVASRLVERLSSLMSHAQTVVVIRE